MAEQPRTRISKVTLRKTTYDFNGKIIPVTTCHGPGDLYHITDFHSLVKILDSGFLKPMHGRIESGSVSFSENPQHTYGSGNIKMIFKRDAISMYLRPMHYYEDIGDNIGQEISNYEDAEVSRRGVFVGDIRSEMALNPIGYVEECEWYSKKPVPANKDTISTIVYMIPWRIVFSQSSTSDISCEMATPQETTFHGYVSADEAIDALMIRIRSVKKVVINHGISFAVDSCFNRIDMSQFNTMIILDAENIKRMSNGERPVVNEGKIKPGCKCD